jgi:multidrug resistance efflux pump
MSPAPEQRSPSEPAPAPATAPASPRPAADGHQLVEAPRTAGQNGQAAVAPPPPPPARPPGKARRLLLLIPILLVVGGVVAIFGYRYWYATTYFVSTDNAQVTGDLVQVSSLNAGKIVAAEVEVGDRVRRGQELAVIAVPQQVGSAPLGGAPIYGPSGTSDARVPVESPLDGIVAARMAYVGATTAAGQPLYAVVDPEQTSIRANIEEDRIWRVQVGQPVEVHVDALGRTFNARVEAISPASAATFSLLPAQNTSGNYTRVTQLVPVKIVVDSQGAVLPLGTSVEVQIQVREPVGGVPWQP